MHHKRGRAKNQRAGCLFCKPHKANGCSRCTRQELRAEDPGAALEQHYTDLDDDLFERYERDTPLS